MSDTNTSEQKTSNSRLAFTNAARSAGLSVATLGFAVLSLPQVVDGPAYAPFLAIAAVIGSGLAMNAAVRQIGEGITESHKEAAQQARQAAALTHN